MDHLDDANTFIIDAYNHNIYPGNKPAQRGIAYDISVSVRDSDDDFLKKSERALQECIKDHAIDFVIYNAGTDCLVGDPLGNLNVSAEGIVKRDELVFKQCLDNEIPVVMIMSGGYQQSNAEVIANSIENLITKFNLIERKGKIVKE